MSGHAMWGLQWQPIWPSPASVPCSACRHQPFPLQALRRAQRLPLLHQPSSTRWGLPLLPGPALPAPHLPLGEWGGHPALAIQAGRAEAGAVTTNRPELTSRSWRTLRLIILERDSHTCWKCGKRATQVDHLIPHSAGGTDDVQNLAAICFPCNNRKNASYKDKPEHTIIW
jgi:hypothetical protein